MKPVAPVTKAAELVQLPRLASCDVVTPGILDQSLPAKKRVDAARKRPNAKGRARGSAPWKLS